MKRKILHITTGLIFVVALLLPSCEFLQDCGTCVLVTVDLDGNVTTSTDQFVCGETFLDYQNSEITYTADGSQYWDCQ